MYITSNQLKAGGYMAFKEWLYVTYGIDDEKFSLLSKGEYLFYLARYILTN